MTTCQLCETETKIYVAGKCRKCYQSPIVKPLAQNKLILVVAHGINKGAFDDVIDI